MGNYISQTQKDRIVFGIDTSKMSKGEIQEAKFYKGQIVDIANEILKKTNQREMADYVFDHGTSTINFNFRHLIKIITRLNTKEESGRIIWTTLEQKYVDPEGNSLFPMYYFYNTPIVKHNMINLAIRNRFSGGILAMINEYPAEMRELVNENNGWSMLHELAGIPSNFSTEEEKLAMWLIKNTLTFHKNHTNRSFLETAICHMSPNFDYLSKLLIQHNTSSIIIKVLKSTSLRENLFSKILKYCSYKTLIQP